MNSCQVCIFLLFLSWFMVEERMGLWPGVLGTVVWVPRWGLYDELKMLLCLWLIFVTSEPSKLQLLFLLSDFRDHCFWFCFFWFPWFASVCIEVCHQIDDCFIMLAPSSSSAWSKKKRFPLFPCTSSAFLLPKAVFIIFLMEIRDKSHWFSFMRIFFWFRFSLRCFSEILGQS